METINPVIKDCFELLLAKQKELCLELDSKMGTNLIETMQTQEFRNKEKWMYYLISCMHSELEEVKNCFPWKNWKRYSNYKFPEMEAEIKYELIDLLHFLLEMFLIMGISGEEVAFLYDSKLKINLNRQQTNY